MHVGLGTSLTFLMGQRLWRLCCISKQMFKKLTWIGIFRLCHCGKESILAPTVIFTAMLWSTSSFLWRDNYCWLCQYVKVKREGLVNLTTWFTEQTSNIIIHSRLNKIQCGLIWHSVPATKMEKIPVKSHLKHMKHIHTIQYNSNRTHVKYPAVTKFS